MNIQPPKWLMYAAITVFAFILAATLIRITNNDSEHARKISIQQQVQQSKNYKAISDSVAKVTRQRLKSVLQKNSADSLSYVNQKQRLQQNYAKQQKNYEARLAAIDSAYYLQFNGTFSIRQMLSDSAIELWR